VHSELIKLVSGVLSAPSLTDLPPQRLHLDEPGPAVPDKGPVRNSGEDAHPGRLHALPTAAALVPHMEGDGRFGKPVLSNQPSECLVFRSLTTWHGAAVCHWWTDG
jgi:hypothetical protein